MYEKVLPKRVKMNTALTKFSPFLGMTITWSRYRSLNCNAARTQDMDETLKYCNVKRFHLFCVVIEPDSHLIVLLMDIFMGICMSLLQPTRFQN